MDRVADLLRRAQGQTGLVEFGEESYREGLEILVAAIDREAGLTEAGRVAIDALILDLLCKRLQIENWYERHPEIDEQVIVAPLIGIESPSASCSIDMSSARFESFTSVSFSS